MACQIGLSRGLGLLGPNPVGLSRGLGLLGPNPVGLFRGLGLLGPNPVGLWFGLGLLGPKPKLDSDSLALKSDSGLDSDSVCFLGADESAFPAGVSKACPVRTLSDLHFVGTAGEGRRW